MLKKFGHTKDGRPLILLGLSEENMTRLMADEPIMVKLPDVPRMRRPLHRWWLLRGRLRLDLRRPRTPTRRL